MTAATIQQPRSLSLPRPVRSYEADFSHLLGGGGWRTLDPAVQARFRSIAATRMTRYRGAMTVKRSIVGLIFAFACRLLGGPLPTGQGDDVPVDVSVFHTDRGGVCWQRSFAFGNHCTTVRSLKVIDPRHGILEVVEGGIGMSLQAFARDGALVFRSKRYFLEFGLFRLPLPLWLTPGVSEVAHIDQGGGRFRFRLTMHHPLFGLTIQQDGIFSEEGDQ